MVARSRSPVSASQLAIVLASMGKGGSSMLPDRVAAMRMYLDQGDCDLVFFLCWKQQRFEAICHHKLQHPSG